jgi:hypothetical protein
MHGGVSWDQNMFNDVYQEYVSGRPMYTRACNFSGHMFQQQHDRETRRAENGGMASEVKVGPHTPNPEQ